MSLPWASALPMTKSSTPSAHPIHLVNVELEDHRARVRLVLLVLGPFAVVGAAVLVEVVAAAVGAVLVP
eukprot:16444161-Heterocapsa_arctica.AAC.1